MQYNEEISKERIDFSIFKPNNFPVIENSWKPVSIKENKIIKDLKIYCHLQRLTLVEDVFNVQQGIRPGNKKVFIISKEIFEELPDHEKIYFLPSIDNDAVKNGIINIKNFAWYPYNKKNGSNLFLTEGELSKAVSNYYANYLLPNKDELEARKKEVPSWWSLSDRAPRLLPLKPIIVSTEFGNSSSFALDLEGNYIVERGYAWKSKKKFSKDDYYFYLALFSSPFFDSLLAIYSKELAGVSW